MATTLMLWDEKGASGGSNPGRGDNKDCVKAMKKAKVNGGAQKRQPQRGLGVAQLERLRLQEQKKQLQEDTVMAAAVSTNTRMPYVSPYGYGRPPHGQGAYSFLRHHHHHPKHLSACSSNRNMFGLPQVACSNHGRSILSAEPAAQLAPSYASLLQKYRFCNTEDHPLMAGGGVSSNNNTHLAGMLGGFEEDSRFRGSALHYMYPYGGRPFQNVHKEAKSFIYDGQFAETSPRGPFLQSVPVAKVGVPLTVDQPKELSSFQNSPDNSNWPDTDAIKNNPWYAMQHRQRHAHNLTAALDLKLTAGENNFVTDSNTDRPGYLSLRSRPPPNFLRSSETSPVFYPLESFKSYQDFFAENKNKDKGRKRQRSEENLYVKGSKQAADILALKLCTTSASVPDSGMHTLGETENISDDTVCEIHGDFQQQANIAEEKSQVPGRTFMFMPLREKFETEKLIDEECPALLEISSNSASAASTDAEISQSSSALDLSLKLAI